MLPIVLYVIGGLLLVGAGIAVLTGMMVALLPQLIFGGLLLVVGLAIERWRYKPLLRGRPDPRWKDTGERFVDPGSGQLTAVYFDAQRGERHYVVVDELPK
ncbi:hypothetical protein [Dyella nitratireducens]|uniref:NfeD-like C-terminal domain-containing protein n=1 Tax=Dyella nitratireducens TaxID=1849580 RepID=A0ABQ1GMM7_9GAMM|nr:hypothetical protein [Dyella nitratireducens]GGA46818.1 hypothetical protein GCM10010981_39990 [Dyella nitratireducens]GLQ41501.1 hypothetical protein GCM10007902_13510 [Dyella nitratireducens]